jgi:hypothetical protein
MVFRFLRPNLESMNGVTPSRPITRGASPREAELQRELDALLAERAALVRQERSAAANLARMQDTLDVLAGEIDKRAKAARDPDLRDRGQRMVTTVKEFWARQDDCGTTTPSTVVAVIKPLPHQFAWPSRVPPAAPSAAHQASVQEVIDAGARARNEREAPDVTTGVVRKLRSDLPPVGTTARQMINIDRKRRGLPPYGDDE